MRVPVQTMHPCKLAPMRRLPIWHTSPLHSPQRCLPLLRLRMNSSSSPSPTTAVRQKMHNIAALAHFAQILSPGAMLRHAGSLLGRSLGAAAASSSSSAAAPAAAFSSQAAFTATLFPGDGARCLLAAIIWCCCCCSLQPQPSSPPGCDGDGSRQGHGDSILPPRPPAQAWAPRFRTP